MTTQAAVLPAERTVGLFEFTRFFDYCLGSAFEKVWGTIADSKAVSTVKESYQYLVDALVFRPISIDEKQGAILSRRLFMMRSEFSLIQFCILQAIIHAAMGDYSDVNQYLESQNILKMEFKG